MYQIKYQSYKILQQMHYFRYGIEYWQKAWTNIVQPLLLLQICVCTSEALTQSAGGNPLSLDTHGQGEE